MQHKQTIHVWLMAAAGCLLLFVAGCEPASPPMDATGRYVGTWEFDIMDNGTVVDTVSCALSMELEQDTGLPELEAFKVTGVVDIDFSCLEEVESWPEWAVMPDPGNVEVTGLMTRSGKITLGSGGIGMLGTIIYLIDGQGYADNDETEIPFMTEFSGNWGLGIEIRFIGAGGVGGRFSVVRDE